MNSNEKIAAIITGAVLAGVSIAQGHGGLGWFIGLIIIIAVFL